MGAENYYIGTYNRNARVKGYSKAYIIWSRGVGIYNFTALQVTLFLHSPRPVLM